MSEVYNSNENNLEAVGQQMVVKKTRKRIRRNPEKSPFKQFMRIKINPDKSPLKQLARMKRNPDKLLLKKLSDLKKLHSLKIEALEKEQRKSSNDLKDSFDQLIDKVLRIKELQRELVYMQNEFQRIKAGVDARDRAIYDIAKQFKETEMVLTTRDIAMRELQSTLGVKDRELNSRVDELRKKDEKILQLTVTLKQSEKQLSSINQQLVESRLLEDERMREIKHLQLEVADRDSKTKIEKSREEKLKEIERFIDSLPPIERRIPSIVEADEDKIKPMVYARSREYSRITHPRIFRIRETSSESSINEILRKYES